MVIRVSKMRNNYNLKILPCMATYMGVTQVGLLTSISICECGRNLAKLYIDRSKNVNLVHINRLLCYNLFSKHIVIIFILSYSILGHHLMIT